MGKETPSGYINHINHSLRKIVFNLLEQNNEVTPSQIMGILRVSYGLKDLKYETINYYRHQFRKGLYKNGLPQKPHKRTFEWAVPRSFDADRAALTVLEGRKGFWRVVSNKNTMLIFRYPYGTAHWYHNGKVLVYLRGELSWAKAKELFCHAFLGILSDQEISRLVDAPIREIGRHWVFDVGQPLPRFEIRQFERSHGLTIYTDGSHPECLEVAETEPFWLHRLDDLAGSFDKTANSFQASMDEHLKILSVFKKESNKRSRELHEFIVQLLKKRRSRSPSVVSKKRIKHKSLINRIFRR